MPSSPASTGANPIAKGTSDSSDPNPPPVPTIASRRLRKIPPIPVSFRSATKAEIEEEEGEEAGEDDDDDEEGEGYEDDDEYGDGTGADGQGRSSSIIASSLGLNNIRTRSNPPPLRLFSKPDEHRYKGRDGDVPKDPRPAGPNKCPPFNSLVLGLGKLLSVGTPDPCFSGIPKCMAFFEMRELKWGSSMGVPPPHMRSVLKVYVFVS